MAFKNSVWGKGLWLLPVILFSAALGFFIGAFRASKSGSTQQTETGIIESLENVPIYQIPIFWFAVVFLVAGITVIIAVNNDK